MKKIIRKIRYDLMEKNQVGKYFKYAIGEIILVVFGILIALQINNWNENRKSDEIRNNYYQQILQDLAKDTAYINKSIKFLDSSLLKYRNYSEHLAQIQHADEVITLVRTLNWEFNYINFNTNTLESLISTGDIKLMPDIIRNDLLDLRTSQNSIIKATAGNNDVWLKSSQKALGLGVINYVSDINPNLFNQINREEDIISSINIINGTFQLKNYTEKKLLCSMKSLEESTEELAALIKEELSE